MPATTTRGQATAEAAVARVLKLARELDQAGGTDLAKAIQQAVSGREKPPEMPGRLAGRGLVAQWLIEDIGEEPIRAQMRLGGNATGGHRTTLAQQVARMITDAVVRYGWDRPEHELERTPPPPMPSYEVHGDGKVLLAWEVSPRCRAEWAAWWRNRPGRNAGLGGRPRRDTTGAKLTAKELADEVRFLTENGHTLEAAATALGCTVDAAQKALEG